MKLDASDISDLKPLIEAAVQATLDRVDRARDRIGLSEPEAAAAMGLPQHVLGDARRRGEVKARKVGKRYVYSRRALAAWLEES